MKKHFCQSTSIQKTSDFSSSVLADLKAIRLITLRGELGSGKTTFVQQIGKNLGIKQKITSPSFVLMKVYQLPRKKYGIKYLCHADYYRAEKGSFDGLQEYLDNPEVLTIIEWPEKIKKLPLDRAEIEVSIINKTTRSFKFILKSEKMKLPQ